MQKRLILGGRYIQLFDRLSRKKKEEGEGDEKKSRRSESSQVLKVCEDWGGTSVMPYEPNTKKTHCKRSQAVKSIYYYLLQSA